MTVALLSIASLTFAQTNLLDNNWSLGSGDIGDFLQRPATTNNIREIDLGPNRNSPIIWKAVPTTTNTSPIGWLTRVIDIDPAKSYRLSVWIKKTNSVSGRTDFGFRVQDPGTEAFALDGSPVSNPYFFKGDLPELNKWYLLVGFVHTSSHTGTTNEGGIYDMDGNKVVALDDFKFSPSAVKIRHRAYLAGDTNEANRQFYYAPTIYEVNNSEPSIGDLLNQGSNNIWSENNGNATYDGNIGIGTADPGTWKLAVNGNIRAKEIKVETGWADYVFADSYELPTLEEVERHIREKGHLINIPSAKEIESNGVELGEMNKLLLEKIEELTLYILQQDKNQKLLEKRIQTLESQK